MSTKSIHRSGEVLLNGYIYKEGHIFPTWRSRWFVLRRISMGHFFLEYYKDDSEKKLKGRYELCKGDYIIEDPKHKTNPISSTTTPSSTSSNLLINDNINYTIRQNSCCCGYSTDNGFPFIYQGDKFNVRMLMFSDLYEDRSKWLHSIKKAIQEVNDFPPNCQYIGSEKDGKMDGSGTLLYSNGNIYQGKFVSNKIQGKGIKTIKNSIHDELAGVYEGEFVNGEQEGYGIYKGNDGIIYCGNYKNGKKNGKGTYTFSNGDIYEGAFVNGHFNGIGTLIRNKKCYFTGTFVNDSFHEGKENHSNGDVYEGNYLNDVMHGKGKYSSVNGNVYEGYYLNGVRSGKGKLISSCGSHYDGSWKNDQMHGYGILKDSNNCIYEGEWKYGKMHGKGKYVVDNIDSRTSSLSDSIGVQYDGDWFEDMMNGIGILKRSDGTIYEGNFKDNNPHGFGRLENEDGSVEYVGEWDKGKAKTVAI
jgi:hypothetical protein